MALKEDIEKIHWNIGKMVNPMEYPMSYGGTQNWIDGRILKIPKRVNVEFGESWTKLELDKKTGEIKIFAINARLSITFIH